MQAILQVSIKATQICYVLKQYVKHSPIILSSLIVEFTLRI